MKNRHGWWRPLVLLTAVATLFACESCSRDSGQATKENASDDRPPALTFVLTCQPQGATVRVQVDPENPVHGLLDLCRAITQTCKPNQSATQENPVELALLMTELSPHDSALLNAALDETTADAPDSPVKIASVTVSADFSPIHLVQVGRDQFAWGFFSQERNGSKKFGKLHEGLFRSPKEATQWLGYYFADVYVSYHAYLAVFRDGAGNDAIAKEAELRATKQVYAENLVGKIREFNSAPA